MTDHKKFKKLVRERMTGTGESHTTARRHVLARAERLPDALVPGYRAFGAAQHRESGLLANVLASRGIAHSEATQQEHCDTHDPYVVAVAGMSADTVYIDDNSPLPHEMSVEDFGTAWAGYRKGRHHALIVQDAGPVDLAAAIRDGTAGGPPVFPDSAELVDVSLELEKRCVALPGSGPVDGVGPGRS